MYLYDTLFITLVKHLEYLEHILHISNKIEITSLKNNINNITFMVENRERLFSIAESSQLKVEKEISLLNAVPQELKNILITWSKDVSKLIESTETVNNSIANILEDKKDDLTKEIATIFNIRQAHEGYNLTSVRK